MYTEHEDQLGTQQRRASQEPQRYGLLLLLHISQLSASTDDIRHTWLAPVLHGTLNVLSNCGSLQGPFAFFAAMRRCQESRHFSNLQLSTGCSCRCIHYPLLYCSHINLLGCTGPLGGTYNVLLALDSGCTATCGSSKHHRCDALPVQLSLVRCMLHFCRGLQTAMSFLSCCCSCVEFKATPGDPGMCFKLPHDNPSWLHVQSGTHRWGGAGVL
jgi:hypothetical protein